MSSRFQVGLMWHGDSEAWHQADLKASRFALAAKALRKVGIVPVAVIYNDDFRDEVRSQLFQLDAVQVWVNPIESGRDRSKLDELLREAAQHGVLVYTHPDTIMKMGTKQVLVDTCDTSFGSNVVAYQSADELRQHLPERLKSGAMVLKQYRGHSGSGIWKFALTGPDSPITSDSSMILLRHAQRGSVEESIPFGEAVARMEPYFLSSGKMIAQPYQDRLTDGMIRIYMVGDAIGGFGHQAINALYPGSDSDQAPQPGPRLYYPPNQPEFQSIRTNMESGWLNELTKALKIETQDLPLLWDADFLLGPKDSAGEDTYVLCEINVSCVSPYPEWANDILAQTLLERIQRSKKRS